MHTRFTADLDQTLARAGDSLALARSIRHHLANLAAPDRLWRC